MALDKDVLERLGLYAQLVFDETKASANTHTRVGQAFIDTHSLFEEVEKDEADIAQLQKDLKTTQDDLSDLDKREEEDIDLVNEKIAAILPRLILPIYSIVTSQVTIQTVGIATKGVAVWCSANGAFAWNAKNGSFFSNDYYGTWGAYGIYPNGNMYHSELSEGANTEVWYYVQAEGAFYYWNGSEMEKITVIEFATQSDLAKKQDILTAGEGIAIENNTITADLTNIVPTALVLEYPESISLQNIEAKKISASLLPEGIIQNIVFLAKGESLEVGLFGDITLLAAGVTRVRVIPTCNTALAKEISISVLDRPLRLVTASSMRLTGSGNLRFY